MAKNEDITMEMAANMALKMLLEEKKFVEFFEKRVEKRLELRDGECFEQPCTSSSISKSSSSSSRNISPEVDEVIGSIRELIGNLRNLIKSFQIANESGQNFVNESKFVNHDAGTMFEAGLKVERICTIEVVGSEGRIRIMKQIGCACRRLTHVMKQLAKKFTLNSKIHVSSCFTTSSRLCDLCYTIAQQTDRFAEEARISAIEVKKVQEISKNLLETVDAFNMIVVEKLGSMRTAQNDDDNDNDEKERHQRKFANCSQEVKRQTKHRAGSISKHILAQNRGFLIDSTLQRARARIATTTGSKKDPPKPPPEDEIEEADKNSPIFQTAAIISREIMDELRKRKIGT